MIYRIVIRPKQEKYLLRLTDADYDAITDNLEKLSEMPRPRSAIKLVGSALWRIRVGNFRIVYSIDDDNAIIRIVKVARRNEDTYKGL
jgi:mRNA interferase RelE/StbE